MFWSEGKTVPSRLPTKSDLVGMLQQAGVAYFVRQVPKDGLLGWGEESSTTAHFVVSGMIEIYKLESNGRKKTLYSCKAGDFFGFQILHDSCVFIASARACVDSELIAIPKESFFKALHTCPDFADMIVGYLYQLISILTNESVSSSLYTTSQRVTMLLLNLGQEQLSSERMHEGGAARAPILVRHTNADIANMLGISRNSVTSSLSRLQEQGIVAKRRNSIEILDMDRLKQAMMFDVEA